MVIFYGDLPAKYANSMVAKSLGCNQSIYDLTYGPHHGMEPILDAAWFTKNRRLDIPETLKKTQPNTAVLLVEYSNKGTANDFLR